MTPLLADLASWWLQAGLLLGAGLVLPPLLRLRDPAVRHEELTGGEQSHFLDRADAALVGRVEDSQAVYLVAE